MNQHPSLLIALAEDRRRILADMAHTPALPRRRARFARLRGLLLRPAPAPRVARAVPRARAAVCDGR